MKFKNLKQIALFIKGWFTGSTIFKYLNREGQIVTYHYVTKWSEIKYDVLRDLIFIILGLWLGIMIGVSCVL